MTGIRCAEQKPLKQIIRVQEAENPIREVNHPAPESLLAVRPPEAHLRAARKQPIRAQQNPLPVRAVVIHPNPALLPAVAGAILLLHAPLQEAADHRVAAPDHPEEVVAPESDK